MKTGFRQSMAWLHTWAGLTAGWVLCAIFLTGTLSVFREPITHWMAAKPSLATAAHARADGADAGDSGAAAEHAAAHLAAVAPGARFWRIDLPSRADEAVELAWRAGRDNHRAALHPGTGERLPEPWGRKTEGGRHFMSFHYTLHGGLPGYWLVGWLSMCMLVALVSGVVVHRRIFKDFFTLRWGKGQRSWLDAHNATAVLTLPFLFMIVYTGVAFFYTSYLPAPLQAAYRTDDKAHARFQAELAPEAAPPARPRAGVSAALHPLAPLLQTAQSLTGRPAGRIVVDQPGDRHMVVRVFGRGDDGGAPSPNATLLNPIGVVTFDGTTGAVLRVQSPTPPARFSSEQIHGAITTLHLVRFGGWPMKWLYFVSGLLGTAMMAMGTVLFMVKRRKKSEMEFGAATARVYRVVEALNASAVAGACIACIAYLYANRSIAPELAGREAWEIRAFLAVWGLTLVHALLRPPARAWVEQLALAAVLCLALPALNAATTGQHLGRYLALGDWQGAGVEGVTLVFGMLLAFAAWRVHVGWRAAPAAPRRGRAQNAGQLRNAMRHRWNVLARVLAASVGGYGLAALAAVVLALALPRLTTASRADGVLIATLLGFVVYTAVAIWVFSVRGVRVAAGLVGAGLVLGVCWAFFQRGG